MHLGTTVDSRRHRWASCICRVRDRAGRCLLQRPRPGGLPCTGERPGGPAASQGRTPPGRTKGRSQASRRDRLMRAGSMLRHLLAGVRTRHDQDCQGPGSAGQPDADCRGLRAADVLPEVRASAVRPIQGAGAQFGSVIGTPAGAGTVVGYSVPADEVIVKVAETGQRCACPRASVCGSRQEYEAMHSRAREGHPDR
jgi:hypothetical protein